ncbi:MAG TPA: D-arabinono-1,4-lactone oxidase [Puia sp.]|jgi:xylitol oxidase|nr:D-arabinono-1,4-lactone oxidase [Puia sp.]
MKKREFIKLSSVMMAGTALTPLVDFAQGNTLTNWAGNVTYSTTNLIRAGSVPDAAETVKRYDRIKVLGTRHCFNKIADSRDRFLSLSTLNQVIGLDTQHRTVTVESGIRYGDLAVWLNDRGYALHNLASLPHISVAGGCITATHGSGVHNANLSSAVTALELITASGETLGFSREKNGELFSGIVINLGGLGVVTSVTLAVRPTYQIAQYVFENLPVQALEDHFAEIMSAGYSVSLFTDWRNGNIGEVWVKSKVGEGPSFAGQKDWLGASAATKDMHPIPTLSAENCTPQMGVPGPWHERLPHFKMGFTPSAGKELQTEYFVPRENSYAAIKAVEQLRDQISPHLQITEIRCIDADDCWMSPCFHQPSTTIHFTWQPDWPAVSRLLPLIEAQLAPFDARPHWGKLFTMSHRRLAALYPKLPEFQHLLREYDPKGKFRNDFLNTNIFGMSPQLAG